MLLTAFPDYTSLMTSVSPSEDAEVPRAARVAAALPRSLRSFAKTTGDRRRGEKERRREIERERERGGGGGGEERERQSTLWRTSYETSEANSPREI